MRGNQLVPVKGARIIKTGTDRKGIVKDNREVGGVREIAVKWLHPEVGLKWENLETLGSGFVIGMEVQDIPWSRTRKSLGEGVVLEARVLGRREQVLVEFSGLGQRYWLPYENLRQIKGPKHRFILGQLGKPDNAERFRLKSLAYAIDMWNENTGSLSRLEIDPLPHQIHLVHHILASGNLNWLIADDVGLGKTIEVGMLLAALQQRGTFRRILLVTPAGLVKQWQEELHHKFGMSDFQIYGQDFRINDPRHWKLHDRVIGSIDRFKSENHLETLLQGGMWDLIVFDEAHRLSRRQWGSQYSSSERFRLAAQLRRMTDAMLLLSATPHQGMQDKFQALLEVLRPELKSEIRTLELNPEILGDMVIRNHKADVTDAEGNFIFQGKITKAIKVPTGQKEAEFDKALQAYLKEGYESSRLKGKQGKAIGFVMTIYRKLAASSIAAICAALERRLQRLRGELAEEAVGVENDERYLGEQEEATADSTATARQEFFHGEIDMLVRLLEKAREVATMDLKMDAFVNELVTTVHSGEEREKLLIFTEYRATQDYLTRTLVDRYGEGSVLQINGSMTYEEREASIAAFEEDGLFLLSTEAGGEGLNLHRKCHIMVNYDLPWNPMRLVQRVGRLYRYGQKKKVVVFNMHAPLTVDAKIMEMMYGRINQVVSDLSSLGGEYKEGLEDEILGELAEMLDVKKILEESPQSGIVRTQESIDDALGKARSALNKQRELFEHTAGFDPDEAANELKIGAGHVRAFVEGIFRLLGIEVLAETYKGRVLDIQIPDELLEDMPGCKKRARITFDRALAASRSRFQMMDLDSPLFSYLMEKAKSYKFDGVCAGLEGLDGDAVVTAMLRWQNDQGVRMRQEYTVCRMNARGDVEVNPPDYVDWLMKPASGHLQAGDRQTGDKLFGLAQTGMDRRLSDVSNISLHPENLQPVNSGWCRYD